MNYGYAFRARLLANTASTPLSPSADYFARFPWSGKLWDRPPPFFHILPRGHPQFADLVVASWESYTETLIWIANYYQQYVSDSYLLDRCSPDHPNPKIWISDVKKRRARALGWYYQALNIPPPQLQQEEKEEGPLHNQLSPNAEESPRDNNINSVRGKRAQDAFLTLP